MTGVSGNYRRKPMTTPIALEEVETLEQLYGLLGPLHIGAG